MTLKIHNCVCVRSTGDASKLAAVHLLFSIQMSCNKKKSIALQQCIDKHVWLNPFQISVHTFHLCAYYVHRSLISINRTLVPIPFQDFSMHKTSLCRVCTFAGLQIVLIFVKHHTSWLKRKKHGL